MNFLRSLFSAADRFRCPLCRKTSGAFREFGAPKRANAQCPTCESLERHRLLWLYLKNRTRLFKDRLKVLHFAPEKSLQLRLKWRPNLDYVSADLEPGKAMARMDVTDIPAADGTYDVILCSHVLEHVPDDRKAMRELYRVLKPGGWAIIQVPLAGGPTNDGQGVDAPEERRRLFGRPDHVRQYGQDDYGDRLRSAGFEVRVDPYGKALGARRLRQYALGSPEDIYFCTKKEGEKGKAVRTGGKG